MMIGQTISHYKVLEKLGEGGMGVVYKGQDLKLERLVALKFLPSYVSSSDEEKARFLQEAKAAAALNHPNICTIHGIEEHDGPEAASRMFIVMEYVNGQTLRQLETRNLKLETVLAYATQIAEALQEAHSKGIVHRDIKSSNIMVTDAGQVKIMDFGVAKTAAATMRTKTGSTVGTVPYMSPEQARGEKVDHRTDIWSLGVVLYDLISGRLPFHSPYSEAIVYSILNEEPKPFSLVRNDVPAGVENIVRKCLQKSPSTRYQQADELIADLSRTKSEIGKETPSPSIQKPAGFQWRNRYLIGAGILVIAFLFVFLPLSTKRDDTIHSIAVLPLDNLSRDPDQEYFADGMTEALITDLAKIKSLRVISRTSVMLYKTRKKTIPEIAKELNVDAVVEGSVQRSDDRVRITAQLLHASTDRHLWAESYDRNVTDVLALQNEIALAIAKEVRAKVTPEEETRFVSTPPVNHEAYESYLKGRYHWNKRTGVHVKKAIDFFNQAIQSDPGYARAYAGLADAYIILGVYDELPPRESFPRAKAAAQKALDIDPSMAEAYASLGDIGIHFEWDWNAVEKNLKRAIELDPQYSVAHHWYSEYLTTVGRHDEAIVETKKARELDPLSLIIGTWVGWNYYNAQKYDSALVEIRKALEIDPEFSWAHLYSGWVYRQLGKLNEAISEIELANRLYENPHMLSSLGHVYGLAGRTRDAERVLSKLSDLSKERFVSSYNLAFVNLDLGRPDKTIELLERAYQERSSRLHQIGVDPAWSSFRSHARFVTLLKKIGLQGLKSAKGSNSPSMEKPTAEASLLPAVRQERFHRE